MKLVMEAKHPDTGEGFDHENLRDQVITLLVAGHKTTTLLSSWCLYLISQNPEVEEKILDEVQKVIRIIFTLLQFLGVWVIRSQFYSDCHRCKKINLLGNGTKRNLTVIYVILYLTE